MSTVDRLMDLAAKKFSADRRELRPDQDFFAALRIDSLKALELLTELELEFGVEVPDYELQGLTRFDELAAKIDERR